MNTLLLRKQLYTDMKKAILLLVLIWLLFFLVFGITVSKGNAMEPALKDGDLLLYYRLSSGYTQADPVLYTVENERKTGRIAAGPGDELLFTPEGKLVINGYMQTALGGEDMYALPEGTGGYPLTLSEGEYFILADDKGAAEDSRAFGIIQKEEIKGKIITIIRRRSI